jgi:hypothetical protein
MELSQELSLLEINTESLGTGLYIVRALGGGKASSTKIMVQR